MVVSLEGCVSLHLKCINKEKCLCLKNLLGHNYINFFLCTNVYAIFTSYILIAHLTFYTMPHDVLLWYVYTVLIRNIFIMNDIVSLYPHWLSFWITISLLCKCHTHIYTHRCVRMYVVESLTRMCVRFSWYI